MAPLIAAKRLFRTADDRIVAEDDPAAAFLFAGEGDEITEDDAKRFGLTRNSPLVTGGDADADTKKAPAPADKQEPEPPNKMRRPAGDKGPAE